MRRAVAQLCVGSILACALQARAERTIAADTYFNKLHGMWLGQLVGNLAGRPTEGVYSAEDVVFQSK
jgi:hypothetical protein